MIKPSHSSPSFHVGKLLFFFSLCFYFSIFHFYLYLLVPEDQSLGGVEEREEKGVLVDWKQKMHESHIPFGIILDGTESKGTEGLNS